jgi:hypothetical protein
LLTNGWNATLAFCSPCWNVCGNLTWKLVAKKLHIVACELHCIYNIIYDIRYPLQLVQYHSKRYKYHELQVSITIGKPHCKPSCKTLYFFIMHGFNFSFEKNSNYNVYNYKVSTPLLFMKTTNLLKFLKIIKIDDS